MSHPITLARSVTVTLALLAAAATPAAAAPTPGDPGLGDRLNPGIGNGGYDVLHYDLDLRYATSAPSQALDGNETILARATQSLSRFNLDWAGDSIAGVSVNGRTAQFSTGDEELVITPRHSIDKGDRFVVRVSHFKATPTEPTDDPTSNAFFITPDGSGTAPQPYYAHLIYPSNDHPRDKATFTFRIDVPAGQDAAANGVELGHWTHNGRTTWVYLMRNPMATELTQIAVGDWDFTPTERHRGTLIRDVIAPSLTGVIDMRPILALEPAQIDYMVDRVGKYPFDLYGTFVPNTDLGFALETQALTVMDQSWFTEFGQGVWDPTMVHELSHMWFGDSVSPYEWSDLWLNEGHASWYEFLYAEENGFLEEDTEFYPDEQGYPTMEELMKAVYAHGNEWRAENGPVARPSHGDFDGLFSFNVYHGGALVLYALRQKIGSATFQRIEREWVRKYRDDVASTDDFIALASKVSGRNLGPFLRDWLYGETIPPMPGHPDWTANPVGEESGLTTLTAAPQHRRP